MGIGRAWLLLALPAVGGLALLGRADDVIRVPAEFEPVRRLLPDLSHPVLIAAALAGAGGGMLIVAVLAVWRRRRGISTPLPLIGDVTALLPRNAAEAWHTAAMSLTAGIAEELAFRLFLPLLITLASGSAALGFALASAGFGAMHLYQGWKGVVATTLGGLLMGFVYLAFGSLPLAMLLHALIDLNGLVVRPVLRGFPAA